MGSETMTNWSGLTRSESWATAWALNVAALYSVGWAGIWMGRLDVTTIAWLAAIPCYWRWRHWKDRASEVAEEPHG